MCLYAGPQTLGLAAVWAWKCFEWRSILVYICRKDVGSEGGTGVA